MEPDVHRDARDADALDRAVHHRELSCLSGCTEQALGSVLVARGRLHFGVTGEQRHEVEPPMSSGEQLPTTLQLPPRRLHLTLGGEQLSQGSPVDTLKVRGA